MAEMTADERRAVERVWDAARRAAEKCDTGGTSSEDWAAEIKWSALRMLADELDADLRGYRA